ncbi:putative dirigent protein [Dioscorea sansibarensis]
MNANHLLLLLLPFVLITLVSQGHAQHLFGKEKVTRLHFFYQERLTGDNPTIVLSGRPNDNASANFLTFGAVSVIDALLTEGEDPNSSVVGHAQGLSVSAGQQQLMLIFVVDFGFTSGEFNGSSVSVLSRNPLLETDRELAVVGGRGKFRMARGFANLHAVNVTADFTRIEYNVTVFHYE